MKHGWEYKKAAEVCTVVTDYVANGSFATLRENVQYKNEKDYAVLVRLADYTNDFDIEKFVYVNKHAYDFLAKSTLYGGEIIMSNVGSVGKSFICPDLGVPMTLAPNSILIRTTNNPFYFYYFKSNTFLRQLNSITSKTALPKFNKTEFKKLLFPVPPLPVQEQICSLLDKLSLVIEKKKQQVKELDNLAQAIFYDMFGDPVENEKGWEVKKLGEYVLVKGRVGWKGYKKEDLRDSGPFAIGGSHITDEGKIDLSSPVFLSREKYEESPEIMVETGDLILVQRGTIGKVGLVRDDIGEATINPCVLILRPISINNTFLLYYLLNRATQIHINSLVRGVAQPMITQQQVNTLLVPVPPLSLQHAFAQKIESIERQKELINQSIREAQTLFDSRMEYYFGE